MPPDATAHPGTPTAPWRTLCLALLALLAALSLPDLFSPPISPTILRQTQTYSQTLHFASAGFSLDALTIDIDGPAPFRVVYEFPVYQSVVGLLFLVFNPAFFWGKLVSLIATLVGFGSALLLARHRWGEAIAFRAGLFLAACPITLLVSAAFQPDTLALALGALSGGALNRWRERSGPGRWLLFLGTLLAAALAKFTVLVPFLPLLGHAVFHRGGRWRNLTLMEWLAALSLFVLPFVAWNLHRATLMDPRYLSGENAAFLIGDLSRFLSAAYYVKPAFILGAMVLCGLGIPLAILGCRRPDTSVWLLVAGVPLYFVLIPTAADQTYYAWPLVPVGALLTARGLLALEKRFPKRRRWLIAGVAIGWSTGFAIAAPYTLRHDTVSLMAANAVQTTSRGSDLILVLNMHDRGTGIGGFNPSIFTLAGRRGWNLRFASGSLEALQSQVLARRHQSARWLVITWFTPDLDPWFSRFLPASFSRCPRHEGTPVDGAGLAGKLQGQYPVATEGKNFKVLALRP
jgi:hypothetical protein